MQYITITALHILPSLKEIQLMMMNDLLLVRVGFVSMVMVMVMVVVVVVVVVCVCLCVCVCVCVCVFGVFGIAHICPGTCWVERAVLYGVNSFLLPFLGFRNQDHIPRLACPAPLPTDQFIDFCFDVLLDSI
jgi:hypothetical protein